VANSPPRNVEIKGQDHMLAYITPEEGGILQLLGGSGAPGPMGIPSFYGPGGPGDDGTDPSDPGPSDNDFGGFSGYSSVDNPTVDGTSYSNDANFSGSKGQSNQSVTQDYIDNYGLASFGPDTYSQAAATASMKGITPTNPYGYNSPFAAFADYFDIDLDYTNVFDGSAGGAQYTMNQIAGLNVDNYNNPNNDPDVAGFDKNQPANQPRSGIQKGFGSLFGRPTGQMTALGPIAAQRSGNPMDALAMSAFNALAGLSLPGIVSNIVGPPQTYAVAARGLDKPSLGYDPTKNPALAGNKGLGTLADVVSMSLTGNTTANLQDAYTGVTSIASDMLGNVKDVTSAVEDAVSFANNPKGGSVGSSPTNFNSDISKDNSNMNMNMNMNDNEGGESKSDMYRPTPDPISTTELKKAPVVGESFIDPELLKYLKRRPAAPVSEVGYNQDLTASSSAKPVDFSAIDRGLGSLQSEIAAINRNR